MARGLLGRGLEASCTLARVAPVLSEKNQPEARAGDITVATFTGGPRLPSARLRVLQHESSLGNMGIHLRRFDSSHGLYPPDGGAARRTRWLVQELTSRAWQVTRSRFERQDVSFLQREFVSTVRTLEGLTQAPRVLDVDDAVWLVSRRDAASKIASRCDLVVAGNSFLAEYFSRFAKVVVVPTAVDVDYYRPAADNLNSRTIIGWSGLSSGFSYLRHVTDAVRKLMVTHPGLEFHVLSDRAPVLDLPADRVHFVEWSLQTEPRFLQSLSVGLMPLDATDWERGKCSYKMLAYLASGVPAVVSPVGMNLEVLARGDVGRQASTTDEWIGALGELIDDPSLSRRLGANGRRLAVERYSNSVVAPMIGSALRSVTR